jgi:pantoate--beta-alanine ligase
MRIITTVAEMTDARDALTGSVGLVPTMGYLHEGHLSLVRRARADNDHVIVSIFVNPTQFGPNEDLNRYPRDEQRDLALLEEALGTQHSALVFIPTVEEIYPPGFDDWVEVTGPIAERLEGAHRPGHFRGVTTVCARLFRIIRPDRAYFGQKDAQQFRIIHRMVEEQRLPVDIIPMPIVREPDGLAMSSRNVYLTPEERAVALRLSQSLRLARRLVTHGDVTDAEAVRRAVRAHLEAPLPARPEVLVGRAAEPRLELDYVSVSDEQTLEELDTIDRPALILLAARVGATRLIDNTIVVPMGMRIPDGLRRPMSS